MVKERIIWMRMRVHLNRYAKCSSTTTSTLWQDDSLNSISLSLSLCMRQQQQQKIDMRDMDTHIHTIWFAWDNGCCENQRCKGRSWPMKNALYSLSSAVSAICDITFTLTCYAFVRFLVFFPFIECIQQWNLCAKAARKINKDTFPLNLPFAWKHSKSLWTGN